jgi:CheY-like chemotaxis protein
MHGFRSAIVADRSSEARKLFELSLRPLFEQVRGADRADALLEALAKLPAPAVVLLDAELPPNGAFTLLPLLRKSANAPAVIVISRRFDANEEARAASLDAIGYLEKPFRFASIVRALRTRDAGDERASVRVQAGANAHAIAVDRTGSQGFCRWELSDISTGGALLATHSAIAVGSELDLRIVLDASPLAVKARVVRHQGSTHVGVKFLDASAQVRDAIADYVARHR